MAKTRIMALAGALLLGSVAAHATWYTDESAFTTAMSGSFYLEDFNDFTFGSPLNGSQLTWTAPGANGYGWQASATVGLWSLPGALSVAQNNDPLVITFTGAPVTAFGAIVADTDLNGQTVAGTVTFLMSNGDTQNRTFAAGESGFLGWTGNSAISSVVISPSGAGAENYATIDHVYTGSTTVPEPMTVTGLALGALALLRRRKKA